MSCSGGILRLTDGMWLDAETAYHNAPSFAPLAAALTHHLLPALVNCTDNADAVLTTAVQHLTGNVTSAFSQFWPQDSPTPQSVASLLTAADTFAADSTTRFLPCPLPGSCLLSCDGKTLTCREGHSGYVAFL